jgi:hypothetical protein
MRSDGRGAQGGRSGLRPPVSSGGPLRSTARTRAPHTPGRTDRTRRPASAAHAIARAEPPIRANTRRSADRRMRAATQDFDRPQDATTGRACPHPPQSPFRRTGDPTARATASPASGSIPSSFRSPRRSGRDSQRPAARRPERVGRRRTKRRRAGVPAAAWPGRTSRLRQAVELRVTSRRHRRARSNADRPPGPALSRRRRRLYVPRGCRRTRHLPHGGRPALGPRGRQRQAP